MNKFSDVDKVDCGHGFIALNPFYQAIRDQPELAVFFLCGTSPAEFTIQDINETAARLATVPMAKAVGSRPHDCLAKSVADRLVDNLKLCLRQGSTIFYEDTFRLDDEISRWRISLIPVTNGSDRIRQVIAVARDGTDRMLAMQLQERRRIAEELHDSTGQHLTALGLALATIAASESNSDTNVRGALADARVSLAEANREIRTLSYLLHPPVLESQGLEQTLRQFALGFGKRAGLEMEIDIQPGAGELPDETALALFRVCQEALTNTHRHAGAKNVIVALSAQNGTAMLRIEDDGIGGADATLGFQRPLGVGLAGMRERVSRLGGSIELTPLEQGSRLVAKVPRSSQPA